jgi:hypothetical protein
MPPLVSIVFIRSFKQTKLMKPRADSHLLLHASTTLPQPCQQLCVLDTATACTATVYILIGIAKYAVFIRSNAMNMDQTYTPRSISSFYKTAAAGTRKPS